MSGSPKVYNLGISPLRVLFFFASASFQVLAFLVDLVDMVGVPPPRGARLAQPMLVMAEAPDRETTSLGQAPSSPGPRPAQPTQARVVVPLIEPAVQARQVPIFPAPPAVQAPLVAPVNPQFDRDHIVELAQRYSAGGVCGVWLRGSEASSPSFELLWWGVSLLETELTLVSDRDTAWPSIVRSWPPRLYLGGSLGLAKPSRAEPSVGGMHQLTDEEWTWQQRILRGHLGGW
ncbi:hypothetical protein N7468_001077 [Penicillium chermesinum]|uniref:Uncharacterized protein n=1 Tax=Penicillium chermesinum TaxID=63820 RepID=A0A9W9PFW4_9EURO|nr:uncharacterized protein N7468_001077 [Penicillium chermesinum]KAJ5246094.1 hypothetical protein N7468_001077 [Penicillium chermesinum]